MFRELAARAVCGGCATRDAAAQCFLYPLQEAGEIMTTLDTNTAALVTKATLRLSEMSDTDLEAWRAFVGDVADAEHELGTPEGVLRLFAAHEVNQELDHRRGKSLGRGIFQGRSACLAKYLLGP